MSYTLKQNGTTIQILSEANADYLTLDNAAAEILRRDNSFVIEKVEIYLHGEFLEVPDCLAQLRAKVDNAVIFEESLILRFNNTLSNQLLEKMRQHKDAEAKKSRLLEDEKQEYLSLKENSNLRLVI